jgi:molybdopterin molybdotransferase
MLELQEALERILMVIAPLPAETVLSSAAAGRIVAAPVLSPIDLPPFDNSAMDGYAVRAADLHAASASQPVRLKLAGQSVAGEALGRNLEPGTCARIFTGAALPTGADAVVMQEDVRVEPENSGEVVFSEPVQPWENTRLRGEDVKRGDQLLSAGDTVTVGAVALLAATGVKEMLAHRQPVVGLISTGSELTEPGGKLEPGKIYESNRAMLGPLLGRAGALQKTYPLAPDTLEATKAALHTALERCDGVITTGGVSVGEHDYVKRAFEDIGGKMDFWKVAVKPGKPFVFGRWREKFLFGLPGNPVSALVTFLLLVRPALLKWQGAANLDLPAWPATLAEPLSNRADRRHFMRVIVDASGEVHSAGLQASHMLSSLAKANGLVDVPPQTTLPAGATVRVLRWD